MILVIITDILYYGVIIITYNGLTGPDILRSVRFFSQSSSMAS